MAVSSRKVIYAALAGNCLIAMTKAVAAFMTGSSAMLSEAVHSGADTGNEILLLYGLRRAKMPADNEFFFGHGKEIYFWSFVVAIVLFAGGAGLSIYKGIVQLVSPAPVRHSYINYGVICMALFFEGASWYIALTEFAKLKGPWGYVQAIHRGKDPSIFILVNISVDFVDPILATAVEVTVAGLDRAIKCAYPMVQRIFIEVETWCRK